jgi:hypothetical protein
MAGVGPVPKENPRRRNEVDTSHLEPEGETPESLKKLWKRSSYGTFTQRWWDIWASSPQAESFEATDWLVLQRLAILVEQFMKKPGHYIAAEIRQQESLLGATVADRMRLRMKQKDDKAGSPDELPPDVTDFMEFRKNA